LGLFPLVETAVRIGHVLRFGPLHLPQRRCTGDGGEEEFGSTRAGSKSRKKMGNPQD